MTVILPPNERQREDGEAERVIEKILVKRPGGDRVVKEYTRTKTLTDTTRRQMVNILTAEMTETHGSFTMAQKADLVSWLGVSRQSKEKLPLRGQNHQAVHVWEDQLENDHLHSK
ncbi:hypothetical protein AOLI_G00324640 [Acnodon oligacanthus]